MAAACCTLPTSDSIMTEVTFIEVTMNRMEFQACEITERMYAQGRRIQIIAANKQQASRLDDLLWTYKPESFVPHGLFESDEDKLFMPVAITTRHERIPGVESLLMMDYCAVELAGQFSHVIHLVAVDDQERLAASRHYWTQLKAAGFTLMHTKR